MNDERFRDLCLGYLLSELRPEEQSEFEAELERSGESRRRELRALRETLGSLALSPPPVSPPPELRGRILARIREGEGQDTPAGVTSLSEVRERRARRWGQIAAAAVLLLIAGSLAVWNARLRNELAGNRAMLESARVRIAALDSANRELAAADADLWMLASPQVRAISLLGTEAQPGARARVFVDPLTGRALLFAYELPILPPDSVYQLWAIRAERPASAGTFTTSATGPARVEIADPALIEGADALAVTVEPAPGQPAPTGSMVLISSS